MIVGSTMLAAPIARDILLFDELRESIRKPTVEGEHPFHAIGILCRHGKSRREERVGSTAPSFGLRDPSDLVIAARALPTIHPRHLSNACKTPERDSRRRDRRRCDPRNHSLAGFSSNSRCTTLDDGR
jgi:hypothetical protein